MQSQGQSHVAPWGAMAPPKFKFLLKHTWQNDMGILENYNRPPFVPQSCTGPTV